MDQFSKELWHWVVIKSQPDEIGTEFVFKCELDYTKNKFPIAVYILGTESGFKCELDDIKKTNFL